MALITGPSSTAMPEECSVPSLESRVSPHPPECVNSSYVLTTVPPPSPPPSPGAQHQPTLTTNSEAMLSIRSELSKALTLLEAGLDVSRDGSHSDFFENPDGQSRLWDCSAACEGVRYALQKLDVASHSSTLDPSMWIPDDPLAHDGGSLRLDGGGALGGGSRIEDAHTVPTEYSHLGPAGRQWNAVRYAARCLRLMWTDPTYCFHFVKTLRALRQASCWANEPHASLAAQALSLSYQGLAHARTAYFLAGADAVPAQQPPPSPTLYSNVILEAADLLARSLESLVIVEHRLAHPHRSVDWGYFCYALRLLGATVSTTLQHLDYEHRHHQREAARIARERVAFPELNATWDVPEIIRAWCDGALVSAARTASERLTEHRPLWCWRDAQRPFVVSHRTHPVDYFLHSLTISMQAVLREQQFPPGRRQDCLDISNKIELCARDTSRARAMLSSLTHPATSTACLVQ